MATPFKSFLIALPQWHAKVTVLIGGNSIDHMHAFQTRKISKFDCEDFTRYCREDMKDNLAVVLQPPSKPGAIFIFFPTSPDLTNPVKAAVVVHELLHCTFDILRRAGVRYNQGSEEAFTYLHGFLVEEFWKRA